MTIIILDYYLFNYQFEKKQLRVCLCTIGKKENLYAQEFIEHYKTLGYNKIFIYDNNDIEDERFEDVIQKDINNGFVAIINIRGYKGYQFASYKECYGKNNYFYDWLSFFDFDEFLEIKTKNTTIQKFLNNKRYKKCQNIKINWVFYSNEYSLFYENKPVQQRINYSIRLNKHIKSTVRGNLSINYWLNTKNAHSSTNKFISCGSSGKIINHESPFNDPPDIKYAFLKHYHFKSFEEYCIKLKKGKVDSNKYNFTQRIKYFYLQNKNDINKLIIMNKIFNLTLKSNKNFY